MSRAHLLGPLPAPGVPRFVYLTPIMLFVVGCRRRENNSLLLLYVTGLRVDELDTEHSIGMVLASFSPPRVNYGRQATWNQKPPVCRAIGRSRILPVPGAA